MKEEVTWILLFFEQKAEGIFLVFYVGKGCYDDYGFGFIYKGGSGGLYIGVQFLS